MWNVNEYTRSNTWHYQTSSCNMIFEIHFGMEAKKRRHYFRVIRINSNYTACENYGINLEIRIIIIVDQTLLYGRDSIVAKNETIAKSSDRRSHFEPMQSI